MFKCLHCNTENTNEVVFCKECGYPLKKIDKKKPKSQKYIKTQLNTYIYISNAKLITQNNFDGVLKYPDAQLLKNGKWEYTFYTESGCSLAEYLSFKEHRNIEEFIKIEYRILHILEVVQTNYFIIGSCDLEDFYIPDGKIEQMILRMVRPLLSKGKLADNYLAGEFSAPEIKNKNAGLINNRTDVYLAAIIFNRLIIKNRYSVGNTDAQLFWGYVLTNRAFTDSEKKLSLFHNWLGNALSLNPSEREKEIKSMRLLFRQCCEIEKDIINNNSIYISDCLKTHTGKNKKILMKNTGKKENEWNEDSIEKWEKNICGQKIKAYLLADGISNCDIGSGYLASNIIRENFIAVLEGYFKENFEDISDDIVKHLIYKIIKKSNEDIWNKACAYEQSTGNIMGSTFIFLFIYKRNLYSYSLGDSLLYLIRKDMMIPLCSPDNTGYTYLKKNDSSYSNFKQMKDKDNINLYVGGQYAKTKSEYYSQKPVDIITLQESDIVIAASDGVLDYISANSSDTNWEKEKILMKKLKKNEPLEQIAIHIIEKDNDNGGGDNLSMILIKAGGCK